MGGAKETTLEKLLKPLRINPIPLGISLTGIGLNYALTGSDSTIGQVTSTLAAAVGGYYFAYYLWGVKCYFKDRNVLKKNGFDEEVGKKRMKHYCNRQAFNVASIENGYRDEAKCLIERTPREEKMYPYLPHF